MRLNEICLNCKTCGEGLTSLGDEDAKLVRGDLNARTLVVMQPREDWEGVAKHVMGDVPHAVAFAVRCTPSEDVAAQKIACNIFTRQLIWAFDAFVVEGDAADELFASISRDTGVTTSQFGPIVFVPTLTGLRKADAARLTSCIATMQSIKSGRVLRKGILLQNSL